MNIEDLKEREGKVISRNLIKRNVDNENKTYYPIAILFIQWDNDFHFVTDKAVNGPARRYEIAKWQTYSTRHRDLPQTK